VREELREKILAYKRKDLQAMLTGAEPRPTFGVVMFTDMDRGEELYGEEHYESRTLSTYLPVPLSGLFGGGQIAPFNEEHRVVENACVAGIFRASLPRQPRSALKPPPADQSDESTPS
jgi:small ligand-binding sensory domain FIST